MAPTWAVPGLFILDLIMCLFKDNRYVSYLFRLVHGFNPKTQFWFKFQVLDVSILT